MKLCICGSRNLKEDFDLEYLHSIITAKFENVTEIVSGCAKGADTVGELYSAKYNLILTKFPARWSEFGRKAGILRNIEMSDYSNYILALWDGISRGTKHNILYSRNNNKQVEVIILDESYLKKDKPKQYIGSASIKKEVADLESLL